MSCVEITFDGANDPERCKCHAAVMRTYREMIKDQPEYIAVDAARRVYSFHHPEDKFCDAALTVERWINAGRMQ